MKAIVSPALNLPKVYRHFAVVTVVATVLLAVFADGENRQAVAKAAKPAPASARPPETTENDFQDDRADGSFGNAGTFGTPMANPGGGRNNDLPTVGPQQVAARYNPTGLSAEEWAKLTPAQREEMLNKLRGLRYGANEDQRQQQIASLVAGSAARSGSAPSDDD